MSWYSFYQNRMNKEKLKEILGKLGIISLGGILWKLGGTYGSSIRKIGVSIVISLICYKYTNNIITSLLTFGIGWLMFSVGYGIPDETDKGSPIGRFWYKICKGNYFWADILTRLTCGILYSLVYIPTLIYLGKYVGILSMLVPILGIPMVKALDLGDIEEVLIGVIILTGYYIGVI